MLQSVQHFLQSDAPTESQAALSLRLTFALAFWGQVGVVALLGLGCTALVERQGRAVPFTGEALIGLSVIQLFAALLVGHIVAQKNARTDDVHRSAQAGKVGALSAAIAQGVILSTPAWFALFAWVVGAELRYILILSILFGSYYLLGFFSVNRYVSMALERNNT